MAKKTTSKRKKRKSTRSSKMTRQWRKYTKKLQKWTVTLFILAAVAILLYYLGGFLLSAFDRPSSDYDGIDISKHQGRIDWDVVAQDKNIKFVYIKATEGSSIVDKHYKKNLREARAAGLKVGSYHFFRGYKTAQEQFDLFSKHVKKGEQDLLPMVDVEETGNRLVDRARLQKNLSEFMDLVKAKYGKYPILYSQYHFYNQKLAPEFNKYHIFIARYSKKEPVLKGDGYYSIWQYSEKGHIKGIQGTVDLDRFAHGVRLRDISL